MSRNVFPWLMFCFALGLASHHAPAQQTIFNVPTADVLEIGKLYVELDAGFKFQNQEALGKFSSFVPRMVVGLERDVEVGLNVTGNIQPGADTTTLVPAIKWRFYKNEKKGWALYAGNHFYIPARNKIYSFGSYTYVAAAKIINKTRLTAGGYVASKNVFAPHALRAGGQFGFEQTLNRKVKFAADWITGRHANGFLTSGVIYNPHPRVTTYWSYSIGNANAARGDHFFLFEVGYNVN
jgi:hypothetical protein